MCPAAEPPSGKYDPVTASVNATSLDPPEISVPLLHTDGSSDPTHAPDALHECYDPTDNLAQCFRHSGWHLHRERVAKALWRTRQSLARMLSFATCGASAYVYRSVKDPTLYKVMGSACHDRFCVPCARERGQVLAANIRDRLEGTVSRFITLTLRTDELSLREALDKLQKSFNALLKSPLWRSRVDGGVAFLEVKYNPNLNRWHPHVHAIVQGSFFPQSQLADLWQRVTGDSRVVDIRAVTSHRAILHYVTTYCSKAMRSTDFPGDAILDEAIHALHGRRLARTFGTWRGVPLTQYLSADDWEPVAPLVDLLADAVRGDHAAHSIIASLRTRSATEFLRKHPERPPPLGVGAPAPRPRQTTLWNLTPLFPD